MGNAKNTCVWTALVLLSSVAVAEDALPDISWSDKDLENQGHAAAVVQKFEEFRKDPKTWLGAHLNPRDYESICTPDWNPWTTHEE